VGWKGVERGLTRPTTKETGSVGSMWVMPWMRESKNARLIEFRTASPQGELGPEDDADGAVG
jgi:hypothetical protein